MNNIDKYQEALKATAEILKKQFPNLSVLDTIDLAGMILAKALVILNDD